LSSTIRTVFAIRPSNLPNHGPDALHRARPPGV
jgi:hypothetical protein